MNKQFVHFFAKCDDALKLSTIYWHEPIYLISPNQTKLTDLFLEEDQSSLESLILRSKSEQKVLFSNACLQLRNPKLAISLYMMATEKSLFVFGIDCQSLISDEMDSNLKEIVTQFIHIIRSTSDELVSEKQQIIRGQFEHIQKLNNELVNTQRQLKKVNSLLKRLNEDLNNRLVKDQLTGLVSRYQFRDEMERMIRQDPNQIGLFAFIDIDNFKSVNDTYGHGIGDEYLKTFALRLKSLPFNNMICIRIAGDEFGIYIHPYHAETSFIDLWKCIKNGLKEPFIFENIRLTFQCSVGFALYNVDSVNIFEIIDFADFAMYQAKESGKFSYQSFDKSLYIENKLLINNVESHVKK